MKQELSAMFVGGAQHDGLICDGIWESVHIEQKNVLTMLLVAFSNIMSP